MKQVRDKWRDSQDRPDNWGAYCRPVRTAQAGVLGCTVLALLASPGCGGGGSSSSSPVQSVSTTLRAIQPTDAWHYDTVVTLAGKSSSSTEDQTAFLGSVGSTAYLGVSDTQVAGGIPSSTTTFYFAQDATTRDFVAQGDAAGLFVPPILALPGSWFKGFTESVSTIRADGSPETISLTVLDSETVSVPAGRFQAWRTKKTVSAGGSVLTSGTYWYAPQIGNFVKAVYTENFPASAVSGPAYTASFTASLTSTNVPLDGN